MSGISAQYVNGLEFRIKELGEQVEKLTKERDALVNAIDNEMVVTHMGVFNLGDDPKVALNKICYYAQDLGKFFAEDACKEQLAALAEQNEKAKAVAVSAIKRMRAAHVNCAELTSEVERLLSSPNLASPVLNRIKAEGMRMAAEIVENTDVYTFVHGGRSYDDGGITLSAAATAIRAKADELEKNNG